MTAEIDQRQPSTTSFHAIRQGPSSSRLRERAGPNQSDQSARSRITLRMWLALKSPLRRITSRRQRSAHDREALSRFVKEAVASPSSPPAPLKWTSPTATRLRNSRLRLPASGEPTSIDRVSSRLRSRSRNSTTLNFTYALVLYFGIAGRIRQLDLSFRHRKPQRLYIPTFCTPQRPPAPFPEGFAHTE